MIINTPASLGELVDKISILHIKNINIKDIEKLKLVKEELSLLNKTLDDHINRSDIQQHLDSLIAINSNLWVIEMIFEIVSEIKFLIRNLLILQDLSILQMIRDLK